MSQYSAARAAIRRPTPCDTAQESCDTHDKRATGRAAGAYVAIQILYRDRGRQQRSWDTSWCRDTMRHTASQACDTIGQKPRYGRAQAHDTATTQPRHGQPRRSAHGLCAQARPGSAPGAPDSVLTQYTVLSHCLGHCSGALFTRFSKK